MGLLISFLLVLSLGLRSYLISSVPPELFGDEVDIGYQALSLLYTGRDFRGHPLPAYFQSWVEWRAPLVMYYTVPSIALLDNSTLGVRLPHVLFGSLAGIMLFVLLQKTGHKRNVSLLASLALILMPWHIHYSRAAFEVVLLLTFVLLGTYAYFTNRKLLSLLFLILGIYTYSTAVIFIPLFLIALILVHKQTFSSKHIAFSFILLIPFMLNLIGGKAQERFGLLSIFTNKEILEKSTNLKKINKDTPSRLFFNRYTTYLNTFTDNYLKAFSPQFLFTYGDPALRHGAQYFGNLIPVTLVPLLFGIYYLIKEKKHFWILWLLISPIPSSLTVDGGFHSTRLILLSIPLAVAIGVGAANILQHKIVTGILLVIFLFQFSQFFWHYTRIYPTISWRWWHVGYQSLFSALKELDQPYDHVYINSTYEPSLIRFAYWSKYPPRLFQSSLITDIKKNNYQGIELKPKYIFGEFATPPNTSWSEKVLAKSLYVLSQRDDLGGDWDWGKNPPNTIQVHKVIYNPFREPLFYIVSRKGQ